MSVFHSLQSLIGFKIFFPSLVLLLESATNDLQARQFIEPFFPPRIFFFTPAPLRRLILDQASRCESPPNVPFPNPQFTLCNSLTAVAMTIYSRQLTTGGRRGSRPGNDFFFFSWEDWRHLPTVVVTDSHSLCTFVLFFFFSSAFVYIRQCKACAHGLGFKEWFHILANGPAAIIPVVKWLGTSNYQQLLLWDWGRWRGQLLTQHVEVNIASKLRKFTI